MSTPEGKVKKWIDDQVLKRYPTHFKYRPPGVARFGRNGMPDCTYLIPVIEDEIGVYVVIEAKAGDNEATDLQMKTLKKIKKCGGIAAIVTDKDFVKMELIFKEIDRRIDIIKQSWSQFNEI